MLYSTLLYSTLLYSTLLYSTLPYRHVPTPSIPKKADSVLPLDQRLLIAFLGVYRVEVGAWYRSLAPWFFQRLHPSVHGGIPGHEFLEVSWDAPADLEAALLHQWVHGFLNFLGFPPAFTDMSLDLYQNLMRSVTRL